MVTLECGHLVCQQDFIRLGGAIMRKRATNKNAQPSSAQQGRPGSGRRHWAHDDPTWSWFIDPHSVNDDVHVYSFSGSVGGLVLVLVLIVMATWLVLSVPAGLSQPVAQQKPFSMTSVAFALAVTGIILRDALRDLTDAQSASS